MSGAGTAACDVDAIHIPGAIQPHGALVAALASDYTISHASANLSAVLGRPAEDVLGRPFSDVVGAEALAGIASAAISEGSGICLPHQALGPDGRSLHFEIKRSAGHIYVEIVPHADEIPAQSGVSVLEMALKALECALDPQDLCAIAVARLKEITGYDRVMAYRFMDDAHGEVVAECCDRRFASRLGQRYPASDIPPHARSQYIKQRVGAVSDTGYVPVPLLVGACAGDGATVDLTHSSLRSVSPCHREYMRAMGVAAGLTIGLVCRGQLWGMLICHHYTSTKVAGREMLAMAHIVGNAVSILMGEAEAKAIAAGQLQRHATLSNIIRDLSAREELVDTLACHEAEVLDLVGASGAFIHCSKTVIWMGRVPEKQEIELATTLLQAGPESKLRAVDDLGLHSPEFAHCIPNAAGALYLPLDDIRQDFIIWFRREQVKKIVWGRNPRTLGDAGASPATLLCNSFSALEEVVRGRSAPWSGTDLVLAEELGQLIRDEFARRRRIIFWSGAILGTATVDPPSVPMMTRQFP